MNFLDPALREFSAALRRSLLFGVSSSPQFGVSGEEVTQDMDDPDNDIYYDIYFTWSRKVDWRFYANYIIMAVTSSPLDMVV